MAMIPVITLSIGMGITAAGLAGLAVQKKPPDLSRIKKYNNFNVKKSNLTKGNTVGVVTGAVLMFFLSVGTGKTAFMTVFGACIGFLLSRLVENQQKNIKKGVKQREILVLFDTVELYMRAGLTMPNALTAAKFLTPSLNSAVTRCLTYWPSGSSVALDVLRREIGIPEADILASLLSQIEKAGIDNLEGIVRREADRLQRMHEAAERAEISRKPTYLMLYRALPLIASLGMVAGVLYMHVFTTLQGLLSF